MRGSVSRVIAPGQISGSATGLRRSLQGNGANEQHAKGTYNEQFMHVVFIRKLKDFITSSFG